MLIEFPPIKIIYGFQEASYTGVTCEINPHNDGGFYIPASEWAPGIWAGTEGWTVTLDGVPHKVLCIDLQERRVKLGDMTDLEFYEPYKKWEDEQREKYKDKK